jgi:hypothetical protein
MSEITNFKTLSFSKASSFNDCEKKFSFSYVEKIRTKNRIHAAVGTFVHEVIEEFFNQDEFLNLINNDSDKELSYLTTIFEKSWKRNSSRLMKLYEEESRTPEEFSTLEEWVKTLIKNYIDLEHYIQNNKELYPDLSLESASTVVNEKRFTKYFEHSENSEGLQSFELQGYIDRLVLKNDPSDQDQFHCSIVDIKTAKPNNFGNEDKKDQIKTYQFLVTKGIGSKSEDTKSFVVTNGYLFFLGGKDIEPKKRVLKVDEKDFEKIEEFIKEKFEKTLKNILIKRTFDIDMNISGSTSSPWKPKPQILCGWCDYKSICDEWIGKIADKESIKPANNTFNRIRHIGGLNKLDKTQKNKFYELFYNSQKMIDEIVVYFEEEVKHDISVYQELIKNASMNVIAEPEHLVVLNGLKNYLKNLKTSDEDLSREIKRLMLIILKDNELDKESAWKIIIEGINLIRDNKDILQNINFEEFDLFIDSSRKIWRQSQSEKENSKFIFDELLVYANKLTDYRFFNFRLSLGIKNFKKEIQIFSSKVEKFTNYLKIKEDVHNIQKKNNELNKKLKKLEKQIHNYEKNLENFENIKIP